MEEGEEEERGGEKELEELEELGNLTRICGVFNYELINLINKVITISSARRCCCCLTSCIIQSFWVKLK